MEMEAFLRPHAGQGAGDQEFAALENTYGLVLPQAMKDFYKRQNGGFLNEKKDYVLEDDKDALSLVVFHPVARSFDPHIKAIDTLLEWQEADGFLPMTLVPFCSDEGDDFYYIQSDGKGEKVYYILHEELDEFLSHPDACLAADSFTDFLAKIHPRKRVRQWLKGLFTRVLKQD